MGSWEDHMNDAMRDFGETEAAMQEIEGKGQVTKDFLISWITQIETSCRQMRQMLENTTFHDIEK